MLPSLKKFFSNRNYLIASIIAGVMVLWMASGLISQAFSVQPAGEKPEQVGAEGDADPQAEQDELTQVRGRYISAKPFPRVVSVKGKTEANRDVDLKAEVGGQVEALPVAKGAQVQTGDVICQLAVEDRQLRLAEARAALAQAQLEYDGAQKLKTGGYQSETAIANAKARLETAKANVLRRELDLQKTKIRAPFDAVVDMRPVEIGDLMRPGDTCATLLDLDPLIVTGQVAEQEVVKVEDQAEVKARLITGEILDGVIRYVSHQANAETRTFRVEAAMQNPDMKSYGGVTAEVRIRAGEVQAHLIPASVLMLDDSGELGVRVVDENNTVRFYNVDMVGDEGDGVWVTGLPETTLLITVGQQYVANGEKVKVVREDATTASTATSPL